MPANDSVIDKLCKAADNHGDDAGDAGHTVGDLQGLLQLCWRLMTPAQKEAFVASPEVEDVVDLGARGEYSVEDLLAEVEKVDR
ncbi:hypothetical protein [Ralstonia pickettii]|uniref:Uncharacterized protein n=2 Tax=Pseudomonadota TaxID=1224 RepID=A0AAW4Q8S8_RALPI|nr:hypothetical protein [Ralstonia pickettii]MBX3755403.1 hypothetical protein [Ralstonia pickettii]MBX3784183.1 hypothetical protein [Ralstonia pickettii]MBX3789275.1 hypothetical protein [Ralstonia pickettii]MBX3793879.1 hypothetical protein [Ralstonia pickettii]MBX3876415.1 hypothetical protein [Ralstonia pickettii]